MTTKTLRFAALALILVAVAAVPAGAASEGRINGTVIDQDGKPLEGVKVVVAARDFDIQRDGETNRKGRFNMVVIDATKEYDITLEKEGYVKVFEPIDLEVGGMLRREWTMVAVDRLSEESKEQLAALEVRNKATRTYNEGVQSFNESDFETAEAKFKEALEELSEGESLPLANLGLARIYRDREEWEAAGAEAERVTAALPDEPVGHLILFDAQIERGDLDQARATIDRLLEIDTERRTAVRVFEVGVAEIRANRLDEAKARFEKVLELAPEIKEAHINLGHIHRAQGNFEGVKANAEAYLALEPEAPTALSLLYQAEKAMGNAEAADAAFKRLASADKELVTRTFFEEGTTLFNAGQREEAKASFELVLAADPDYALAHYYLGLSFIGADEEKAKHHLGRFLELAPEHPEAATAREALAYYD